MQMSNVFALAVAFFYVNKTGCVFSYVIYFRGQIQISRTKILAG